MLNAGGTWHLRRVSNALQYDYSTSQMRDTLKLHERCIVDPVQFLGLRDDGYIYFTQGIDDLRGWLLVTRFSPPCSALGDSGRHPGEHPV